MTDVAATTYILIKADNSQVISELKKLEGAASASGKRVEADLGKKLQKAGGRMSSIGKKMTRNLTLPLVGAGVASVKLAMDFETSMKTMEAVAGVSGQKLENLSDLAMKMGRDTVFSATDAANAMLELAKAGISPAQIEAGALEHTLALATAGQLDLATASTITANAMKTFGLSGKDSQIAVDALAGAANASSADVSDLAMALSMGGNAAATAGLSIEETTAVLGMLADQGIRGSDAGTSLKTMLLALPGSSGPAREKIRELGLEFFDANENVKSMSEIAQELQDHLGDLSQKQRMVALRTIFGSDAFRAANIVLEEGAEGLSKYTDETSKTGNAAKVGEKRMSGFAGTVEELKGSMETAGISVGKALIPPLTDAAQEVTKVANAFTNLDEETQKNILLAGGGLALLGPVIRTLGAVTQATGGVVKGVKKIGPAASISIAVAATALVNFWRSAEAAEEGADDLLESFSTGATNIDEMRASIEDTTDAAMSFGTRMSDFAEKIFSGAPTARDEWNAMMEAIEEGRAELDGLSGATRRIREAQLRYVEALLLTNKAREEGDEDQIKAETRSLMFAEQGLTEALKEQTIAAAEARIEDEKRSGVRRTLAGITDDVRTAELDVRDAQRQLRDTRKELNALEEKGIKGGRKYRETVDAVSRAEIGLREARRHQVDTTKDLVNMVQAARNQGKLGDATYRDLADAFGLSDDKMRSLVGDLASGTDRIKELGDKGKLTKAEVDILTDVVEQLQTRMLGMPHAVTTKFKGQGLSDILVGTERFKQFLDNMNGRTVVITYRGRATGVHIGGDAGGGTIPIGVRAAKGFDGVVREPTVFMVGENRKAEHVAVTPLQGPNVRGPRREGFGSDRASAVHVHNHITINGPGLDRGWVRREVEDGVVSGLSAAGLTNARRSAVRSR